MPIKKKRCIICHKWFLPNSRTSEQICCDEPKCRKQFKAETNKRWRKLNSYYEKTRNSKKRTWEKNGEYHRRYRRAHPAYVKADNLRRSKVRKNTKMSARQASIREIVVEKLKSTMNNAPDLSARQVLIDRRVDIIIEYLFPKEIAARQAPTDLLLSGGP